MAYIRKTRLTKWFEVVCDNCGTDYCTRGIDYLFGFRPYRFCVHCGEDFLESYRIEILQIDNQPKFFPIRKPAQK